ncbi:uncharacterized protein DFL_009561 [Arthrobotrys flagrans]|uniref:Hemimethylated DNA-binding domain-containing protein n=1 Tax=Arthrobotrys flagrans TaxID=97331 RepID=A0A436ZS06_ARTFL|nr:hypothetical protein DFL_009561 [Arthrobotrys flagrans]
MDVVICQVQSLLSILTSTPAFRIPEVDELTLCIPSFYIFPKHIIEFVPDDDLAALEGVSRELHRLTNDPLLWRGRCHRFKYWENNWHHYATGPDGHYQALQNWKRVFFRRIQLDREARRLLEKIVLSPSKRIKYTEKIAAYGYDVKDYLIEQLETPESATDWLARRFHASSTLSYIHRQRAIHSWSTLLTTQPTPLEIAISSFDLFVIDDFAFDNEQVQCLLTTMRDDILHSQRDFPDWTIQEKAVGIVSYMRSLGFLGCSQERFHDLVNCFIGVSMRTTKNIVFQPELESRLEEIGVTITPETVSKYLHPATTKELVLRNARNILRNTPRARRHLLDVRLDPGINIDAAEYAALFAIALLSNTWTTRILEPLCRCLQESFPLDVGLIEKYIVPLAGPSSRPARLLQTICIALRNEDGMVRRPKSRSLAENRGVLFRIGTIFKHKRYGYQAVITGWTVNMAYEGLDIEEGELQKGLMQPFYRVMVDDLSIRYVAQENILEQRPLSAGRLSNILAGRYFQRFNSLDGRFVSNMKEEYPDD